MNEPRIEIPLSEKLKSVPGFFGIRLDQEPSYEVLNQDKDKEIRLYESQILASISMASQAEEERNKAFMKLAAYIFGQNKKTQKISMTTPVLQSSSQKLPMTTPVLQKQGPQGWKMSFVLPKGLSVSSAPEPLDPSIEISEVAPEIWASLRYTGNFDDKVNNAKARELEMWVAAQSGFRSASEPRWAQYDAPFTIPFLKRNEVQIQVLPLQ